jgi:hypothetical protein
MVLPCVQALVSCVAPPLLAAATTVDAEAFHLALDGVRSDLTTALSVPHVWLTTEAATCAAHTLSHLYAVLASRCDHLGLPSAPVATAQLNAAVALLAEATAAVLWPGQAATQWSTPQFTLAAGKVPAGGALQLTLPGLQVTLHASSGGLWHVGGQPIRTINPPYSFQRVPNQKGRRVGFTRAGEQWVRGQWWGLVRRGCLRLTDGGVTHYRMCTVC